MKVATLTTMVGDDLSPKVEVTRKTLTLGDSKFMSDLTNLVVMDKSVGLCYQVGWRFCVDEKVLCSSHLVVKFSFLFRLCSSIWICVVVSHHLGLTRSS